MTAVDAGRKKEGQAADVVVVAPAAAAHKRSSLLAVAKGMSTQVGEASVTAAPAFVWLFKTVKSLILGTPFVS